MIVQFHVFRVKYGRNISHGNKDSSSSSLMSTSQPSARHNYHHLKAIKSTLWEI